MPEGKAKMKKAATRHPAALAPRGTPGPYVAPPVQRAVRLIRHVAEGNAITNMSETAKALAINRTTLLRLLHTLELEGFVERRPSGGGFQVGLSLIEVGARALFSQELVQAAVPVLGELAEKLELSAHLGVLDGTDVLYLVRRTPNTPLASNIRVGSRLPAHATTMGRMLLAFMPPLAVEALYAGKELARFSEHTSPTLAAVQAMAERDRHAGIAWSEGHFERGIGAAAVPVFDFGGAAVGAINVSGPVDTFTDAPRRARIEAELRAAGAAISRRLGFIEPATVASEGSRALLAAGE
jgi:DNA-binding IclR family transcriptional regulator